MNKANDFMSKGDFENAITEYQKALRSKGNLSEAQLWLGIAYERLGNRQFDNGETGRAIEAYKNAVRYAPDPMRAQSRLGLAYERLGDQLFKNGETAQALEAYKNALASVPEDPYWHKQLGIALEKHGDREAAIKEYRTAAELSPLDGGLQRMYEKLLTGSQGPVDADFTMTKMGEHIETVGGEVSPPIPIQKPDPAYSERARQAKLQGTLVLLVVIDRNGDVGGTSVIKPLGLGLDAKALETVRTWKFQPATRNGTPVPVRVMVEIQFKLF
jgi:TonB family protein